MLGQLKIRYFVKNSDFLKDGFLSCEKILCESIMWFWRRIRSRFCPLLALARQGVAAEKRTATPQSTFEQLFPGFSQLYVYMIYSHAALFVDSLNVKIVLLQHLLTNS